MVCLCRTLWKPPFCISSCYRSLWDCFSATFHYLAGLQQHGVSCLFAAGLEHCELHNALHPEGPTSLWGWLPGTTRYLCSACNNQPDPHAQTVCGFRLPLCLLCSGVSWKAACPSMQFKATLTAEHSSVGKLGHCRRPRLCNTAQHGGAWCLWKANAVWLCISCWCIALKSLFFLSVLFFPSGF